MTAISEKIEPRPEFPRLWNSYENEKEGIEIPEEHQEGSIAATGAETRGGTAFELAVLGDEQERVSVGQPGNWRSKVGILLPNMEKWNPSFRPPTIGRTGSVMWKVAKFYGPGAILSVAYIDPDNYQTDISAGAEFAFKLLFMLLISNLMAIYLQSLCAKLGAVTGLTLAEMNRIYLPRWLNYFLWAIAEATIICTDIGQVIGTAIAINILNPKIPLLGGCALSILDAFTILLVYNPKSRMFLIRPFEIFVAAIAAVVFIFFCIELGKIEADVGQVFKGYLPSREVFVGQGLYVGSSLVHARLREFDIKEDLYTESDSSLPTDKALWRPSYRAIKDTLRYTIWELCITVFVVATFVNSAIVIVSAARLPESASDADIYGMYALFQTDISNAAAAIMAVALLFSGTSAGIVATMAGQIVMEGALKVHINPFYRRLVTRLIAIIPAMIVSAAVGPSGVGAALNNCNVVLSLGLIFLVAPIVWFTSNKRYMTVVVSEQKVVRPNRRITVEEQKADAEGADGEPRVNMANGWFNIFWAVLVWVLIVFLNVAALVFIGLGQGDDD